MAPRLSEVFWRLVRLGSFLASWRQANVIPILKGQPSFCVANYQPISITSALSKVLHAWCLFVLNVLWNAVVCFQVQPPSLLIVQVWVPTMHFCGCPIHSKVQWRVLRRLGLCRLISVQPLIGLTIRVCSIGSALWVLEVLCCLYWHSFYQTDHSTVWSMVVRVNWLTIWHCVRSVTGQCFGPIIVQSCSLLSFFPFLNISWSLLLMTLLWWLWCSAPKTIPRCRVIVAESLIHDLGRVSEWCDLRRMKLNASKTKTTIVSRSRTMHPQSPPLTIGRTILKESDDRILLGVTFDHKMTLEKHLHLVSRTASPRLVILKKSWRVFHDGSPLERCFRVLSCPFWSTVLQCGAWLLIHTLNY